MRRAAALALALGWAACTPLAARATGGAASTAVVAPAPLATPAVAPRPAASDAHATDADPYRAIAIAEDQRRWPEPLRGYLAHADEGVRARAALAVGRLQDSTSVPALLPLLADPSLAVRREAAFALGQIGHRSARAALEPLAQATDPQLATLAVEALGKLGDKAATPVVVRALDGPYAPQREAAAMALWRLADSTAVDALIAHTDAPDPQLRWRVLHALEKTVAPDRIVLRAALHLSDPDPLVRAYAARTIGFQMAGRGVAYLLGVFDDPDVGVAVNAIRAVQLIADTTCAPCAGTLVRALGAPHPYVRVTAATALADSFAWVKLDAPGRAHQLDTLAARLHDPDAATRGAAARALLARGGESQWPRVEPLLGDSSVYARAAVLEGLRKLESAHGYADVLEARMAPGHPLLERMTAADVLGDRHEPGGREHLRAALADTSLLFVSAVAGGLANAGDTASVPRLVHTYVARGHDAEPDARMSILDALRQLGAKRTADSLEKARPWKHPLPTEYPPGFESPPQERGAVIHTSRGDIEWGFDASQAPQTVRNFVTLARRGYFDHGVFHRVVPNFVIQDGDPTGTGSGGPGYTIRCEYNRLHYVPGAVGMALAGKDTGGSQWFITHSPQLRLDGRYTIFAHVVRGMDVVQRIVQGDRIDRVEVLE